MNMKRKSYTLFLSLMFTLLVLSACGNETDTGESNESESITLTLANELPGSHPWGQGAEEFKSIVEEETNGEIVIEVHNGGSLGSSGGEIQEGTSLGTIDIGISSTPLAQILPEVEIFS